MNLSRLRDVMMDSHSLWKTLRAQGTEWRDFDLLHEAFIRKHQPGPNTVMIQGVADRPSRSVEQWSLRIELPDTVRTEFGVFGEHVTAMIKGAHWWSISSHDEPRTNDGNPKSRHGTGPGNPLTEPRRLVFGLELEPQGETTFAGRPVVRVSPLPWSGSAGRLDLLALDDAVIGLGTEADRYEFWSTPTRLIIRSEAQLEGSPFLGGRDAGGGFRRVIPRGDIHPRATAWHDVHKQESLPRSATGETRQRFVTEGHPGRPGNRNRAVKRGRRGSVGMVAGGRSRAGVVSVVEHGPRNLRR